MRSIRLLLAPMLALGIIAFTGCDDDDDGTGPITGGNGTLNMYLTDAPGDFDEVHITFSEISLRRASGSGSDSAWTTISTDSQSVDLLTLTNGQTELIGHADVESGSYSEIRLLVESAQAVKGGQTFDVTIPSGSSSGLKIMGDIDIQPDVETNIVLDFNTARSFHRAGNSGQVIMNPVIRVAAMAQTGSISGTVDSASTGLAAYALANSDTVSSTYIDETNGQFKVSFLPAGNYLLVILNSEGMVGHSGTHTVNAGQDTNLGMIALNFVPGDSVPGDSVPGDSVPGDSVPGDSVPGDSVPGDTLPGDSLPGDTTGAYLNEEMDLGQAYLNDVSDAAHFITFYPEVAVTDRQYGGEIYAERFKHPAITGFSRWSVPETSAHRT